MSALIEIYFKTDMLVKIAKALAEKEKKGLSITASVSDNPNQWGQNVSAYISQTKEERESGKQKYYVGNGKVFWTDGSIQVVGKKEEGSEGEVEDDLPI